MTMRHMTRGLPSHTTHDLFPMLVTGDLGSTLKNNTRLDPEAIATWATGIVGPVPTVHQHMALSERHSFQVFYIVRGAALPQTLELQIANHTSAAGAQRTMKEFLAQSPEPTTLKKPESALGQAAVQATCSMWWIRDSLYVRVGLGMPDSFEPVPLPDASDPHRPPSPMEILLDFARRLDDYLAAGAVPPSSLQTPIPTLQRTSYRVSRGESFHVQLVHPEHLHHFKRAIQPTLPSCVRQMGNGSMEGRYTFLATRPGTTRVTLLLARSDNLAMERAYFDVEVTHDIFEEVTEIQVVEMERRYRDPIPPLRDVTNREHLRPGWS